MDGFQFLRALKTDEALKSIPFVFYSAVYTGHDEARLAISLGAEAFIIKPKDPDEFWEEIIGILEECKLRKPNGLTAELIKEEEDFLRKYSHIVAAKLEEKVTELQKAKAKVEEHEKCYRHLFSSIRDVVITADMDRVILDANQPALRELFGYELEEIIGEKTRILYADDSGFKLTGKAIFDSKGIAKGRIIEVDFRKKNNEIFHGELYALKLLGDDEQAIGNIGLIRDITEHKKLEEQLRQAQKMEAIGQLAGGVAHDFNNILSAIIGYGSLTLMKMQEDDPLRNNIDEILQSAQRATVLTQSLLAFSRKQLVNLTLIDINELVRRFEKFLLRLLREDIELKIICTDPPQSPIAKGGGLMVMADSGQIEQVLMNLATNARDAISGSGRLTIKTRFIVFEESTLLYPALEKGELKKGGKYALISVSDTGAGMDEKTKEKIFEPFFTTKEVGKGTGLGLAMVYGIIKKHEGYINVYSESGHGTTFNIYLPVVETRVAEEDKKEPEVLPLRGGTETVLVAEDDPSLRKLSTTVLRAYGYNVIEAVDGEEAVNKFIENKDRIHLAVLDGIMPKKNGKEVYDEIILLKPDTKVIFMSGYSEDIFNAKSIKDKGLTYMLKPVSPADLLRKVREVLDK